MRSRDLLFKAGLTGLMVGGAWASLPPSVGTSDAERVATDTSAYYANCSEVRALGKAPIYSGQPGYRPEMDGDGDGIACEPYRG